MFLRNFPNLSEIFRIFETEIFDLLVLWIDGLFVEKIDVCHCLKCEKNILLVIYFLRREFFIIFTLSSHYFIFLLYSYFLGLYHFQNPNSILILSHHSNKGYDIIFLSLSIIVFMLPQISSLSSLCLFYLNIRR